MATELFITQLFSQEMVVAGENLINRLDSADAEVKAAFWVLEGDEDKPWKLIIVSPLVTSEGPRSYYRRINNMNELANPEESVLSLHDIYATNIHNRFFKAFCSIQDTALWKKGVWLNNRLGKNYLSGVYFDDMYIYRINDELIVDSRSPITTSQDLTPLTHWIMNKIIYNPLS